MIDKKITTFCRPTSSGFITFFVCLLLIGLMTMFMPHAIMSLMTARSVEETTSVWLFRSPDGELMPVPVTEISGAALFPSLDNYEPAKSPFMLPPGGDKSGTVYTKNKPEKSSKIYSVSYYDPRKELSFLGDANFLPCEYNKCKMTKTPATADAVIYYAVKLKTSPTPSFKRKPGQRWILKTNEGPSRFSWFVSLNRTGIRDQINWTMTHKLDSDIPTVYGRLMDNDKIVYKNYNEIYESKTRTAVWFVSHCPVRSDRLLYIARMEQRIDIDGYGACGTLKCGQGEKIPGVVGMRIEADKETCFPLISKTYKFYLAFENSLCQEYITEKFFKLFGDVDVIPVVRGGADYKSYFPPGTYVDAADFSSPEALADFLDDLGNDKERFIFYLKNKNRYRVVWDFPAWECKLCKKLHLDHQPKRYKNIQEWYTKDSCADPKDFV